MVVVVAVVVVVVVVGCRVVVDLVAVDMAVSAVILTVQVHW